MPGPGSKNQANRTKGNVRPSSSSQAAQLLSSGNSIPSGFIGFGMLTGTPAFVPASQSFDDIDSSLDADFRLVLRKLTKRDPTTKIKALQEFSSLCKEKDNQVLKAVLPYWPRTYNKLTLDLDHRVREAVQQTMTVMVGKVRRDLAPYLKNLMGNWLLSQYDTYPTVASAAQQSFQTAFPPAKQTEAINFCKKELVEYFQDNLIHQTMHTLSDPSCTEADEMETKYNRVVTGSFLALRKVLLSIPASQQDSLTDYLKALLENGQFWKHGKSKVNMVKAAMFAFLASLCQTHQELSASYAVQMVPPVFHNIDEKDPVICSSLWEAALSIANHIQDWTKHISISKSFWPKLRSLLEAGFNGNVAVIGPNLLPLFSKVPEDILGKNGRFHEEFFSYFKRGLSCLQLTSNPSDLGSAVKAYMECIQYCLRQMSKSVADTTRIQDMLFDQILPVVQASLIEVQSGLSRTPLYGMLGMMMSGLEQMESSPALAVLGFWNQLGDILQEKMMHFGQDLEGKSSFDEKLVHLVKCLLYPKTLTKHKTERVRFTLEKKDTSHEIAAVLERIELGKCQAEFVQRLTLTSFKHAHDQWSPEHLKLFGQLIELDSSATTVSKVIQCCHSDTVSEEPPADYFVFHICLPWLKRLQEKEETLGHVKFLIQIIFVFIPVIGDCNVKIVLDKLFENLQRLETLHTLVDKLFMLCKSNFTIKQWMKSEAFGERMVSIATNVCDISIDIFTADAEEEIEHGWAVLSQILSCDENDVPLLSTDSIQRILICIHNSLQKLSGDKMVDRTDRAVKFVSQVASSFFCNFKGCLTIPSAEDLLLMLFSVSLGNPYNVTEESLHSATQAWLFGVKNILQFTGGYMPKEGAVCKMVATLKEKVSTSVSSVQQLQSYMEGVKQLLEAVCEILPVDEDFKPNPVIQTLSDELFIKTVYPLPDQVLEYLFVSGEYLLPQNLKSSGSQFPNQTLFSSLYNCKLLLLSSGPRPDTEEAVQKTSFNLEWTDYRLATLLSAVLGRTILTYWMEIDSTVKTVSAVEEAVTELSTCVTQLMGEISAHANQMLKITLKRCEEDSQFCLSVKPVLEYLSISTDVPFHLEISYIIDNCSSLTECRVHLIRSILPYFTLQDCLTFMEIMVARLLSCPSETLDCIDGALGPLNVITISTPLLISTHQTEVSNLLLAIMDQVLTWKENQEDLLLFDGPLSEVNGQHVLLNAEICHLLQCVVRYLSASLSDKHWDFTLCSLVSWIQCMGDNQEFLLSTCQLQSLTSAVCDLLSEVMTCIVTRVMANLPGYPPNLASEWTEFFSDGAYSVLLPLFLELTKEFEKKADRGIVRLSVASLGNAVSTSPKCKVMEHRLPPLLIAGESSPLPDSLQTLINHFCPLLGSGERAIQVTAFAILHNVMEDLPQYDKEERSIREGAAEGREEEEDNSKSPPVSLVRMQETSREFFCDLLTDLRVDQCSSIFPTSPEYHSVLAYLLSWKLMLTFFKSAPAELRQAYASYLKTNSMVERLLFTLFRLMPNNPGNMFEVEHKLDVKASASVHEIQRLACGVYLMTLETTPAMVRQWWKEQDRNTASYVDKYTSKHVSHLLCNEEIQTVQKTNVKLDNMTIKTRAMTREVIATYALAEVTVEMVITLPSNYPLGNIQVQSEKRVGVSGPQWEKWLLQLNIFLQHQNGSIMDGLRLWKNNIDKRFEGVEECTICYSVLHGTNFQLPRLQCKTCKKKFHSACLVSYFFHQMFAICSCQ
ncbi:hypothetical protein CHS0354_008149 [Potamilus streckersoni]|uniref:E3 ubiquitin-protein ligase listerin n=1 Tax=Potamilus streckersoni TaxID=2493646 RepID=A0AAE0SIK1_9BIVA|nr:hypothetical protein CHS0354_008149 [Potamilus streckersoni]